MIHRNKSLVSPASIFSNDDQADISRKTVHVLHHGRALYTLIKPGNGPNEPPSVRKVMMGANAAAGEVRQLVVGGDEWKASEIPAEDLQSDRNEQDVSCLITEVVVPGFYWADHEYLTKEGLEKLFATAPDQIPKYMPRIKQ